MTSLVRPVMPCPKCNSHFGPVGNPELLTREPDDEIHCDPFRGGCGHKFKRTDRERELFHELETIARKLPLTSRRQQIMGAIQGALNEVGR